MITGQQKSNVLRAVVAGSSLPEAASKVGVKTAQARTGLKSLCRRFCLPDDVVAIRSNRAKYLEALDRYEASPELALRPLLAKKLAAMMPVAVKVTPEFLSNIEAPQLLASGFTCSNIHDIETWLNSCGHGLRRAIPATRAQDEMIAQCISMLQVFSFDVSAARAQLDQMLAQDIEEPGPPDA